MKDIHVVIGANYGDEGKGRATAHWVRQHSGDSVAAVRFNGGAQAGHTVIQGSRRHVFSHLGAGTLDGAPTILTSDFVCSPYLFNKEWYSLSDLVAYDPVVLVSPECPVTTPWDGWLNQVQEIRRGSGRHGSVGVGFGETIERQTRYQQFGLTVQDLTVESVRDEKLKDLIELYLPARLGDLDIKVDQLSDDLRWMYDGRERVMEIFKSQCDIFLSHVTVAPESQTLNHYDVLVFEGAQGLALDQNSPDFPHVTRSNTGLDNVLAALSRAGISDPISPTYVTRCYLTRHGAGPLPGEINSVDFGKYFQVVDETNRPHQFQGSLRFAPLGVDAFSNRVRADLAKVPNHQLGSVSLMVTCLDQATHPDQYMVDHRGVLVNLTSDELVETLGRELDAHLIFTCHGADSDPEIVSRLG